MHIVERRYSTDVVELCKQFGKDLDITRKSHVLVNDNTQNIVSAVNQTGFIHIPCLVYCLQLSIFHGFKAADTERLSNVKKIIGYFKHSSVNTTEFQNCSDSPLCKLQQDVPTRWNSIFAMLQCVAC